MKDVSIIIVSYNTKEFVKQCIDSIVKTTPKTISYEIILVDNASSDGTVEEIQNSKLKSQNYNSKLKIIKNKENVGFSKANNIGIKESSGKYVLFLNPDTLMHEKTLEELIGFMEENPDAGAVTCKVELHSGGLDDASHRGFPTPWNSFSHFSGLAKLFPKSKLFSGYTQGWKDLKKTHEIDACAGAFMLVRRVAGEQIEWWDEDYFFYGEDLEFCFDLKEKGWKIYYVPTVSVTHYKGVSGGIKKHSAHISTANQETQLRATNARFNAMKIFYKKHYMQKYPGLVNWLVMKAINAKLQLAKRSVV